MFFAFLFFPDNKLALTQIDMLNMITMKGRRFIRIIIIVFSLFILVSFGITFMLAKREIPPVNEIEEARELISDAYDFKANYYSLDLLNRSENYYDSAMISWQNENKKIFFARDYARIKKYAHQSAEFASKARDRSMAHNSGERIKMREKLDDLKREIDDFSLVYDRFPLPQTVRLEYSRGNELYSEAEQHFTEGEYVLCEKKITDAGISIYNSYRKSMDFLKDYLRNYFTWQQWAWSSIDSSIQNQSSVILVDKFSRNLFIYQNGILTNTFHVELGANWIGDKRHAGDKATPEGFYRVTEKLESGKTKFYKALLLNYPNEKDLQSFNIERQNGTIYASTEIGGAIEIHGQGGVGSDWTNGCIALKDSDMDIVYGYSSPGTLITIVGSLKSFDEIMKN
jgi:L,D-peptidoglycan transpeptidase YkuD (ErfK/YbiS/YcfS/YnhG family)